MTGRLVKPSASRFTWSPDVARSSPPPSRSPSPRRSTCQRAAISPPPSRAPEPATSCGSPRAITAAGWSCRRASGSRGPAPSGRASSRPEGADALVAEHDAQIAAVAMEAGAPRCALRVTAGTLRATGVRATGGACGARVSGGTLDAAELVLEGDGGPPRRWRCGDDRAWPPPRRRRGRRDPRRHGHAPAPRDHRPLPRGRALRRGRRRLPRGRRHPLARSGGNRRRDGRTARGDGRRGRGRERGGGNPGNVRAGSARLARALREHPPPLRRRSRRGVRGRGAPHRSSMSPGARRAGSCSLDGASAVLDGNVLAGRGPGLALEGGARRERADEPLVGRPRLLGGLRERRARRCSATESEPGPPAAGRLDGTRPSRQKNPPVTASAVAGRGSGRDVPAPVLARVAVASGPMTEEDGAECRSTCARRCSCSRTCSR